jgi:hypothetical protein
MAGFLIVMHILDRMVVVVLFENLQLKWKLQLMRFGIKVDLE